MARIPTIEVAVLTAFAASALLALWSPVEASAMPDDALHRHVAALEKKLSGRGFTVVVESPFVVVGDEAPDAVRARARDTVKWAVDRLKRDYFAKDPTATVDIWLFRDEASYNSNVRALFNHDPVSPYGYYSPEHGSLFMNISTGGGTLVHEIVHPFVEANFPECPAWFNEGLASLYEQCGDRGGRIHGFTNWRLAGLQRAIRAGTLPTFEALTKTSSGDFYEDDRGSNYAQARYLCYYLQERGLLTTYYREFAANRAKDPTGYATLVRVLGERDMPAFQARWEKYVLGLSFPERD